MKVSLLEDEVEVIVEHGGSKLSCPKCGRTCPGYDKRRRRRHHLDTCQLKTLLVADVPRVECAERGVVNVSVPWAEPGSGFTAMFEALVEIRIDKGVVSKDHVHILFSSPPNLAPSEIMRRIKGRTSSKLFEEFPHIKKRYWGRYFWARGYFCATVGQMTEEMIKEYLEHHFEPNPNDDFKMEPD